MVLKGSGYRWMNGWIDNHLQLNEERFHWNTSIKVTAA